VLIPFIEDSELESTLGLEIDAVNGRLLVVDSTNSTQGGRLFAFDLISGQRLFIADLASAYPGVAHIVNDVAVDPNGNAYVTDTHAYVIYKVDLEGNVEVFIADEQLTRINGIVYHPEGYLLTGAFPHRLFKVPIDQPEILPVALAEGIEFAFTDGMILAEDGSLIMVTFPDSIIYRLTSDDEWLSASFAGISTEHRIGYGTTVAEVDGIVYVIYSHLSYLQMGAGHRDNFEIVPVEFGDN
jgi:hypothetical protein